MTRRIYFNLLFVLFALSLFAANPVYAEEASNPLWGFRFTVPEGWKFDASENGAILGHATIPGLIIVLPHQAASEAQVNSHLQRGIRDVNLQLYPKAAPVSVGGGVFGGDYTGTYNGQQVKARALGTCSPKGGGAFIIALTYPANYTTQLSEAADFIAAGIRYESNGESVGGEELVRHFTGTWTRISANTTAKVFLYANGTYRDYTESIYSGKYNVASQGQGGGRWTVTGTLQQGTMTFTAQDGSQSVVEYRVNVQNNKVYWNEYWIDGKLYGKS